MSTNNPTPRLTEGTRVRYTAREDTPDNYGINGVTGVVTKDDGNDVVPYIVRLDSQVTVSGFGTRFATDHIAADGIELEILP